MSFCVYHLGCRSDVSLPIHEALCWGRALQASSCALPASHVRLQWLQRPVPPPRLLASPTAWPQRLWSLLWHLHPAQPDATAAATKGRQQLPADALVLWAFIGSQLPAPASLLLLHLLLLPAPTAAGRHLHLTQISTPSPPPKWAPAPVSAYGSATLSRASPSLSHAYANECVAMLSYVHRVRVNTTGGIR